ncbi:MAG: response regulator [Sedimentisphaerales bacterium]|nr:response regulator [Sedimentisphaerales bacterium]
MQSAKPILLAEDDDIDAMTVKRALKELNVANQLVRKCDGEQALEYLREHEGPKPCLILLDLNMPKMNGLEFLEAIKADEKFRAIPVIALTTSGEQSDIIASFRLGVAGYMVKSVDYAQFLETMRVVDEYWSLSKMPESADPALDHELETLSQIENAVL